jgi:APA family basic amino acid/polyamine antiporter
VIYLRRAAPELPRGFKVPLYPVLPVLGILSCLYLITTVPVNVLMFFVYYMIGAVVLYFLYGIHNSNLQHGEWQDDAPDMGEFPGPVIDD